MTLSAHELTRAGRMSSTVIGLGKILFKLSNVRGIFTLPFLIQSASPHTSPEKFLIKRDRVAAMKSVVRTLFRFSFEISPLVVETNDSRLIMKAKERGSSETRFSACVISCANKKNPLLEVFRPIIAFSAGVI